MKATGRTWCGSRKISGMASSIKEFLHNRSGSAIAWTAISLPIVFGAAGMGVDATLWYMDKRIVQNAADSAAVAATHVLSGGGDDAAIKAAAEAEVEAQGFDITTAGAVIVNNPPAFGPTVGTVGADTSYVEVIINHRREMYLAGVLSEQGSVGIQGRAVGGIQVFGNHCVVALDETMDAAIEFKGTANATIDCGVASNSNSEKAISITGTAYLDADPAQAYGDVYVSSNATLVSDQPVQSLSQRVPDPYGPEGQNLQVPANYTSMPPYGGSCNINTVEQISDFRVLDYTVKYCGGLKFNAGAIVIFDPGIYVIEAGDFVVNGSATLNGTEVTFILTAVDPADIGGVSMNGDAQVNLSAITTGPFSGILFYQDQRAPSMQGNNLIESTFNGSAAINLLGAMYFPKQEVVFSGGVSGSAGCLQIVAKKVTFSGTSFIQNSDAVCQSIGVAAMDQSRVVITE